MPRLVFGHEHLVQLLAGPDADRSDARHPGATPSAMSMTRMLGILGTKISPPCISGRQLSTNSTASSSVIQKRVMRSSVIVITPVARLLP